MAQNRDIGPDETQLESEPPGLLAFTEVDSTHMEEAMAAQPTYEAAEDLLPGGSSMLWAEEFRTNVIPPSAEDPAEFLPPEEAPKEAYPQVRP